MKSDVGPKIDKEFVKMEKYYITHLKRSHADIARQMESVKQIFINKYERIIAKRIKEGEEKEKLINIQLDKLRYNLESISNL